LLPTSCQSSPTNVHEPTSSSADHPIRTTGNLATESNPAHTDPVTRHSLCTSGQLREFRAKYEAAPEPRNLRRIKAEVQRRWGTVALIDILKEAVLRTGCLNAVSAVAGSGTPA
jgi:hypothetical protein